MTLDGEFVKTLVEDYDNAPLTPTDRVMLDYVGVLTKDATRVTPDHHRRLREVGFDDHRHPPDHAHRVVVQLHQPRGGRAGRRPRPGLKKACRAPAT